MVGVKVRPLFVGQADCSLSFHFFKLGTKRVDAVYTRLCLLASDVSESRHDGCGDYSQTAKSVAPRGFVDSA